MIIILCCHLLFVLLAVDAAPLCFDGSCFFDNATTQMFLREHDLLDLIVTETHLVHFSATETEISTEVTTITEDSASSSSTTSVSQPAGTRPDLQFVGVAPDISDVDSVLFLPFTTSSIALLSDLSSLIIPSPTSMSSDALTIETGTSTILVSDSLATFVASPINSLSLSYDPFYSSDLTQTSSEIDGSGAPSPSSVEPAVALHTPIVKGPLISAYYPDWVASSLPPESIDMARFDWIDFAFVTPDEKFNLAWDDASTSPGLLKRLVSAAHVKGAKVKVSIGGWSGSRYFSSACATASSRSTFVNNIVAFYQQYSIDGIDIDWEYPGQQGAGNNVVSPQDSANFLSMLKLLRTSLPSSARITAAVQDAPFVDSSGNPMNDVSSFATVLDWVNIMNYDIFQSSSTPGPDAPLSNGCHNSTVPTGNAVAAVNAWISAKFPAGRLMLGVPAYGYVNPSHATSLVQKRSLARSSILRRQPQATLVTVSSEDGVTNEGQVQFNELVSQGALVSANISGASSYVGFGGFTRFWDSCSSTPFLTSPYQDQVITYDDPQSLQAKAAYAKQSQLLGTAMWDLSGDTAQWDLTNALRQGLGKS